ncbi:tyrosine-type recombinase/integrase [Prauserella endophytica]|uniref:Integrase n=1 Tax=Prauserella endophytica TaxID=1592324 RepID=A0ABY2S027_9PSEU|nr:tyrosine-type recombinase/integrase [Prauserella endophytica]PXY20299.1 hypothetical protein BAY59_31155 [Prauserella coralliicola]TKG66901.1 integrase [Prauserella endophytica]
MPTPPPIPAPEPWEPLIAEWRRSLRAEGKSENTIKCYGDVARKFHWWSVNPIAPPEVDNPDEWIADLPTAPEPPAEVDELKRLARAWIAYRVATTSKGNANNNYRALHAWFGWLVAEDELDSHPMASMKPPEIPEALVPITPDDIMRDVLATCNGKDFASRRDEAIIRLLWDTGCRLAEVAALDLGDDERPGDLDLNVDTIRVLGKGDKLRVIPFDAKTGKAISRYLRVRSRHKGAGLSALWLAEKGARPLSPNGIKLMLRRRGRAAGVNEAMGRNLHAHLGRHYQSHHFLKEGGSEGDLMLINGWTTPQMARRYGKSAATERAHATARRIRVGSRL